MALRNLHQTLRQYPIARDMRMAMRRWDGASRALPDFVIIGAQKSGTSSLHRYLLQHPEIVPGVKKEVHFFDGGLKPDIDTFAQGENWYRAHFPHARERAPEQLCFEASPFYMFFPQAAARMAQTIPNARLIAVLRNPVERTLSHYFHSLRTGHETRPLRQALEEEDADLDVIERTGNYKDVGFRMRSYKRRGLYAQQLSRFYEHFPREQILVIRAEDLFARTAEAVAGVLAFLGKQPTPAISDLRAQNAATNRGQVEADVLAHLDAYFAEPNRALSRLLDRDFGW